MSPPGGDHPERRRFESKDYLEELFGLEYQPAMPPA